MKKLFAVSLLALLFACTPVEKSPEYVNLDAIRDSLEDVNRERDNSINEFLASFNEIEENLAEIKKKEKIITLSTTGDIELSESQKNKIQEDIQLIYDLLQKNKQELARMSKKLNKSEIHITELNKTIEKLNEKLTMKDGEINDLNNRLAELDIEIKIMVKNIDSLAEENEIKSEIIEEKTQNLNTAYYAFGTRKELFENKVTTKEGGFIGLGKTEKLKQDFNKEYFTKIDIREVHEISLFCSKAKLITGHPTESYEFTGTGKVEKLLINDPDAFWSASRFLVISIEQ